MISEGQRNDINYAIPLLDHVDTNGSNVLADRGYDNNKLIDYIYTHGGEPTIPSRKGAKFIVTRSYSTERFQFEKIVFY